MLSPAAARRQTATTSASIRAVTDASTNPRRMK
jgi:hypothetical protein